MENTELLMVPEKSPVPLPSGVGENSESKAFIEANTIEVDLLEMKDRHIIPVFSSTNEPLISHPEFIDSVLDEVISAFPNENVRVPQVRVSHPIKGRIPEAKHKPAALLDPWEETLFYERSMFIIEVPGYTEDVNGNLLTLTIGGVKAYSQDNMHSKRCSREQVFKMFIGFKNKVCANLCVWSDGLIEHAIVTTVSDIRKTARKMIAEYQPGLHLKSLKGLNDYSLSQSEFAQVIGRARLYQHLPKQAKKEVFPFLLGDQQVSSVAKEYFRDPDFSHVGNGDIPLWRVYNLLTGANKSSYIDSFLERSVNAFEFVDQIAQHKAGHTDFWYMG